LCPDPIAALPFVATRGAPGAPRLRTGRPPRCFWHVKPTGNLWQDTITGEKYALEYLKYLHDVTKVGGCGFLPSILQDMPRNRSPGRQGIEIGFLSIIDVAASAGRYAAEHQVEWWDKKRAELDPKTKAALGAAA
jgi:hypothetical protein